jgi:hypothetical protein
MYGESLLYRNREESPTTATMDVECGKQVKGLGIPFMPGEGTVSIDEGHAPAASDLIDTLLVKV